MGTAADKDVLGRGAERLTTTMQTPVGSRISLAGGYDFEPPWLRGREQVVGTVLKWIPGQNDSPACVVELEEPITATGDVRGKRQVRTGRYLVLKLRYAGQDWEDRGTVHVELCETEPADAPWPNRESGAWVESHATYRMLS
ncbi:hypothetical protein [Ornithinicoccus halotolerans]|uniref:hypothetical protein n=1 Tax=Ornithinicoccus halotolerans TaxID=1748220 RepID=UPI00129733B5|nr:hypothetical protein [Ornithinicoccus halotolerans]